jgi:hypothetical protein
MNKLRFSMLLAAALTIVTIALPVSAANTPNPHNGSIGFTAPQTPASSTNNEQVEPVGPPPDPGDFVSPVGPPPDPGDFVSPVGPPPDPGDFVSPVGPPPDPGD